MFAKLRVIFLVLIFGVSMFAAGLLMPADWRSQSSIWMSTAWSRLVQLPEPDSDNAPASASDPSSNNANP